MDKPTPPLLLGLDMGTSGIRCIVFNEKLEILSSSYVEYPLIFGPQGQIEQDAALWYELSLQVISQSLKHLPDRSGIQGLSISSQGISFVVVDEKFKALRPAISWLDLRGESCLPEISGMFSPDEIMERTGKKLIGAYTLPKLLWLRQYEPDVWRRVRKILLPMDYVMGRMTGRYLTDHTLASGTMYYNLSQRGWDRQILERLEIDPALMPEIYESGTAAGKMLPDVAAQLELSSDVIVSIGGQDQKCASLAAGLDGETLTLSLGTAAALEILMDHPAVDPRREIPSFSYLFDHQWVGEGAVSTAGAAMRWFVKDVLGHKDYALISQNLDENYLNNIGGFFIPELSRQPEVHTSSVWPCEPSGVFWGLSLSMDQADMVRMVMEGVTFEVELLRRDMMQAFSPLEIKRLRVFGGGANSETWCRMIADTTGLVVETLSTHETAAAGAAILAGMGSGLYKDGQEAAQLIRPDHCYEPNAARHVLMNEKIGQFAALKKKIYAQERT